MSLPESIAAMLRPEFYTPRPSAVTLIQTHISYVVIAGTEVYKVKKPVRFSFLDFSTLERRRHFCREEVRLNRRLARDVYHGVVAICRHGATYEIGPEEDPAAVEYAVHMRRLPDDRTLDRLLDQGLVSVELVDRIAARLVDFHRAAESSAEITAAGSPAAILQVLEDNYNNARPFRGRTIAPSDDDAIQAFARTFLSRHAVLFQARQEGGRIRDCHGDLHSEHVCVTNGLVIFDCIEFNPRFRHIDVASDIAFLAMDFDYHDRSDLSEHLVQRWAALAEDADVVRLVPFYKCARAYVRGQVDSMKSAEGEVSAADRGLARASAAKHFALAYRYTWTHSPWVVAIAGLSGTGKSTVATSLHQRTGFTHISSDPQRKKLAQGVPAGSGYETGMYTPELSVRTYQAMRERAAARLASGAGVILDATFQRSAEREAVRQLAQRFGVPFLFVECVCEEATVRRRLAARERRGHSASDADWSVYLEQRRRYEAFAPQELAAHLLLSTEGDAQGAVAEIEAEMRRRTASHVCASTGDANGGSSKAGKATI
jgi:aminoglycoside phosphotransferase family enzyme/predicted kinase